MSQFDWPINNLRKKKKKKTMEAPQNRRIYLELGVRTTGFAKKRY
jgi:hypothetical protein